MSTFHRVESHPINPTVNLRNQSVLISFAYFHFFGIINSLKQICIITEDKGNGYQFVLSYILQNYPEMSGIAIGAVGKDIFRYILEEFDNYDAYVFVIDRGISDVDFNRLKNTLEAFKNSKRNTPMYIFQPKCMEEVCISFYRLNEYIDLNKAAEAVELHYELEKLLTGNIADIDYSKYKTLQYSTDEKVCEKLIFELTEGTLLNAIMAKRKSREYKNVYRLMYLLVGDVHAVQ